MAHFISSEMLSIIKGFEGCKLESYKDAVGVWTIGYGFTSAMKDIIGTEVVGGMKITQAQADKWLTDALNKKYMPKVDKYDSKYHWTQSEADALCSFAFNIGSIDQLTDHGTRSKQVIADKMILYNKAGGRVLVGLTKRRQKEREVFLSVVTPKPSEIAPTTATNVLAFSVSANGNTSISQNFKIKEFRCKDGSDKVLIDIAFVKDKLQRIRTHFGQPITINSAYRTESYNAKVGGAKSSYHMKGRAFDIVVKDVPLDEVCKYAQSIGIKGIIRYNTFVHIDSRDTKYYARNNNGKVTNVTSFL